ncbi:MAG TPA: chromate efflux transporter [Anaerolineaceae bacterium]|nr:chromate efflux transporter [Anaerolineaceae bacterium]
MGKMGGSDILPGDGERGNPDSERQPGRLKDVVLLFLKLGVIAFGGPAAHIAMMHDEVVMRRKWLSEERFLELLGAANLIPGPTSTEMAIYISYQQVGWIGLILGGVFFILPAMVIVMALAWSYVQLGSTPVAIGLFYGIKPVVIAIVAQAVWTLGRKVVKNPLTAILGLAGITLYLLGVNVLVILVAAGIGMMAGKNYKLLASKARTRLILPLTGLFIPGAAVSFSLPVLFLTFLKIGAVLYGSGYVLLAFLRADFVTNLGWLTDRQLIDAIAIGQVTPGPVFTTATFIGYLLGGVPGALVATVGIFLPSFLFVAFSSPLLPYIRKSALASAFLEGVTIASIGLMVGVTLQLSITALVDPITVIVAVASLALLFRFHLNSTWLIAGGAIIGLIHAFLITAQPML